MEDSWEICPYCQRSGFKAHAGTANDQKTRLEFGPAAEAKSAPPVVARKTVLLSEVRSKGTLAGWLVVWMASRKARISGFTMAKTRSGPPLIPMWS